LKRKNDKMKQQKNVQASAFVIFGATGDLMHRKLLPALYFLEHHQALPNDFSIICTSRSNRNDAEYKTNAEISIKRYSRVKVNDIYMEKILSRIHYHQVEFSNLEHYKSLAAYIKSHTTQKREGIVFYLATSPVFFDIIVKNLALVKLAGKNRAFINNRVVFEKPFGKNLATAKKLNREISKVFWEKQIFRIDHYLAKELVQNLIVMRFANSIFEPLWSSKHIDHVQITVAENLGIEGRGEYYDNNGSLRDVMQNHIIQLLCLTAMECPVSLNADAIRDEKVKVLRSIGKIRNMGKESVKGQYISGIQEGRKVAAYCDEEGVRKNSTTSTYFAIKFFINNRKWRNVPFYVRTGKHLKGRATEIVIRYKGPSSKLFTTKGYNLENNQLIIRVQPDEGITFKFNVKIPGSKFLIDQVSMDFCHECRFGPNTAEAYERLLSDIIGNDQTLFTRWDEVEHAWRIIDSIRDAWHNVQPHLYMPGTWGPKEADILINKDGRNWAIPQRPSYSSLLEK